jgi:hypothetical protein
MSINTNKIVTGAVLALSSLLANADQNDKDLFFFIGEGGYVANVPVSTSMHDAGSASASYTLGSGGKSVQSTGVSYESSFADAASSSGNSSAGAVYDGATTSSGEASVRRENSSTRPSSTVSGATGSSYSGAKDGKGVIPEPKPQPSPLIFSVEAGYQSDYVYRGLSQIGAAVLNDDAEGMYYAGVSAQWKGIGLGFKYIRSSSSDLNPRFRPSKSTSYAEYVLDANYTLGLLAGPQGAGNWLDLTVGYQLQAFEEDTFWNTSAQHSFYGLLKMNRYQWVRPSIAYYNYTQNDALNSGTLAPGAEILEGDQMIFQIDGAGQVFENGTVQIAVSYYAQVGWDNEYNTADTWNQNWYQVGLAMPVSFGNFSVIPNIHYTDTDMPSGSTLDLSPDFWWGIKAKYTF